MVEYLNISMLQIYYWVHQWKKFENRLFGEVIWPNMASGKYFTLGILIKLSWEKNDNIELD